MQSYYYLGFQICPCFAPFPVYKACNCRSPISESLTYIHCRGKGRKGRYIQPILTGFRSFSFYRLCRALLLSFVQGLGIASHESLLEMQNHRSYSKLLNHILHCNKSLRWLHMHIKVCSTLDCKKYPTGPLLNMLSKEPQNQWQSRA